MSRVSQMPSQTGAAVANNDLLMMVDVGTPNISEQITLDQFAQAPQFSSRYQPLASDRIWIDAARIIPTFSTFSTGTLGNASGDYRRVGAALWPDGDRVGTVTNVVPQSWASMDVFYWWSNAGTGSGNVLWRMSYAEFVDGETTDVQTFAFDVPAAAPAQYVVRRTKMNTTALAVTSGEMMRLMVARIGSATEDTLANNAGLLGVELLRVS